MRRTILFALPILLISLVLAAPAHAGEETVPDVVGLSVEQAKSLLDQAGFSARVEFVQGRPLGIVFSQAPGGLSTRDTSGAVVIHIGGAPPKPGPTREPVNLPPTGKPPTDLPPSGLPPSGLPPSGLPPSGLPPSGLPPIELPPIRDPKPDGDLGAPPAGSAIPSDLPPTTPTMRPPVGSERGPTGRPDTPRVTGLPPTAGVLTWKGRAIPAEPLPNTNGPDLPSVLGQAASQAQGTLNRWRVNIEQTQAMPALVGKVLNQWPYAGTKLAPGEMVTVVVGVANAPSDRHRGVPQVVQRDWRDAVRAVERAGFAPVVTAVPSSNSRRGTVISQAPLPGSMAPLGSPMRIRVGRGPGTYTPGSGTPGSGSRAPASPEPARVPVREVPPRQDPVDDGPPAGVPATPINPPIEPRADVPPTDTPVVPPSEPVKRPPPGAFSAPSLNGPPAGESYPHKYGADFSWAAVNGAAAYELELQEELPSGAWQSVKTYPVATTRFRPARLERGRYRWRVRAVAGESKGSWSAFRRLYMY